MPEREAADAASWDEVTSRVRQISSSCADRSLERLRIVDGDLEIEVRRRVAARPAATVAPQVERSADGAATNGQVEHVLEPVFLRSDVVGIVRLSRPAVGVGAVLDGERELAYVESLGVRNPVASGGAGRISAVLVDDGQPVEYGQPLFAIER